ncbi:hypothetical protein O6H91_03G080000 [Diphasiastrum complanatum]|uniref:Uncharacterized protein n=1 Tax=Diphasiastrum complanatum TaxID=34168 RepID=A0ACC2E876_DIPCM|nr:hypothetical protein O6H91_03G080000 [Diphasiastrum complanatum]
MEYPDINQHVAKGSSSWTAYFRGRFGSDSRSDSYDQHQFGKEANEDYADGNRVSTSFEPSPKVMKMKWHKKVTSTLTSFVKHREIVPTRGKKLSLQNRVRSISQSFRKDGRGVLASFRTALKFVINRKCKKQSLLDLDSVGQMQEEGQLAAQINDETTDVSLNPLQKGIFYGAYLMEPDQQSCNTSAANQLQNMSFASGSNLCQGTHGKSKDPIACEQLSIPAAHTKAFESSNSQQKRIPEEVETKPKSAVESAALFSGRNSSSKYESPLLSEYRSWLAANPLEQFEYNCPPGGLDSVVLYFTSLQAIRKTFDDCKIVRLLLQGFQIKVDERDVAMHRAFKVELQDFLRLSPVNQVPRLFIKGRYVGGAEEVVNLNEDGTLVRLLNDCPKQISKEPCNGCAGVRFILCTNCNGSRKSVNQKEEEIQEDKDEAVEQYCQHCNEIGLIRCVKCL